MRKRLRKKKAKKATNLFKIRKKLAIADLVIRTYKAYAGLIKQGHTLIVRQAMAWGIHGTFTRQRDAIIYAREAKEDNEILHDIKYKPTTDIGYRYEPVTKLPGIIMKGCSIPHTVIGRGVYD